MKDNPKISIVTPTYNQGAFIEETIRSVLEQDYTNFEHIIMDGGSTDGTVNIIEQYAADIAYWVSAKDEGQSDALERGFARATGEILTWLNSDDTLAPGALSAVAAAFGDGSPDLVAGIVNIKQDGRLAYRHRTGCLAGRLSLEQLLDLDREWITGRFFYQPEVFFSRDIYDRAGGTIDRSLHYSMDYDLWLRCARAGAMIRPIDCELANFRMHAEQKTSSVANFLPELTRHAEAFRATAGMPPLAPRAQPQPQPQARKPRVGLVNDYGFRYGAGRAHGRIAACLASAQYDVVVYAFLDAIGDDKPSDIGTAVEAMRGAEVDVIIVGNLHGAFEKGVDLTSLASVAPLLVVTHDFFQFTGRCPYPLGCDEYLFKCPATCPTREQYPVIPFEEIPEAHSRKLANLELDEVHLLANSAYMERSVRGLLAVRQPDLALDQRVHRIPLPVPEAAFRPGDREAARAALKLDASDFMVLTVSSDVSDRRKGFRHAMEACRLVGDSRLRLFALGWIAPEQRLDHVTYLGHIDDDTELARCFQAADVFISAAADETFGQTFVEAAMCGCPSIGYAVGGVLDAVVPGQTGWLVERNDIGALADTLRRILAEDVAARAAMRRRAHVHATSRWGAASFLSAMNEIFRSLLRAEDVAVPTGVQFDGILTRPIRFLKDPTIVWGMAFDPLEGPFPEHGIDHKLRWMTAPEAKLELHMPKAGPALLTLHLANIHKPQEVRLSRGDDCLASFDLPAEAWSTRHEVTLAIDLPAGETTLRLSAERFFETPTRNLHLAAISATLARTEVADGFRGVFRRQPNAGSAMPHDPAVPASNSPDGGPPGATMQPDLRLLGGFHMIEGPYPEIGVPMRLAWMVNPTGSIAVTSVAGDDVIGLDVHLPCRQEIVVRAAGQRHAFRALNPDAWEQPTRLVIPLADAAEGWHEVEIECANHFVDDVGRALHLAILGAQATQGRPPAKTSRYGLPDMTLAVRAASVQPV